MLIDIHAHLDYPDFAADFEADPRTRYRSRCDARPNDGHLA